MASILIIEDVAAIAHLAARLLIKAGHQVISAETGESGLMAAFETPPDLILVDFGLPDIDGQTVVALLRQEASLGKTRIAAFSACPEPDRSGQAAAYRCHAIISKPLNPRRFVAEVEAALNPTQECT